MSSNPPSLHTPHGLCRRAPTRLDFGGGWTDVPPYPERDGGFVCNVAIARYATARMADASIAALDEAGGDRERASDHALVQAALGRSGVGHARLRLHNDFPLGAGLGGSSAAGVAAVAAIAAWRGETLAPEALAERSRALEVEELGIAGGRQDHYAAVFGGALGIAFGPGEGAGVEVERIPLSPTVREALERRCIVVYTGQSRISGDTIVAVRDAYEAREPRVVLALRRMRELAGQMADALRRGDVDALGALVGEHWAHQRSLHPAIPTPRIDEIVERGRCAGALGAKALGASGGGCVLVIAGADGADRVREAVASLGEPLDFTIDEHGVHPCP